MNTQNSDVGAVDRAAHVQAASQGHPDRSRHVHAAELLVQTVHNRLHHAGGVRGGCVTVDPSLSVDDIGNARTGTADGELVGAPVELPAIQVVQERFDLILAVNHELDVVPRGEAQISVAVFVRDLADLAEVHDAHEPGSAHADRVDLIAGFGHMYQHARLENLMIEPLAVILLDVRRKEFLEISGTYIGDSIFHGGKSGIVRHRLTSCYLWCFSR